MFEWLRRGGTLEDASSALGAVGASSRFFRHFHDPLRPWDQAGLLFPLTLPPRFTRFESSLRWAQRADQRAEATGPSSSWDDARRAYLSALTHFARDQRDLNFATTFRALGQIMHLVVDASVPEHVRDDPHPMGTVLDQIGVSQTGNYEYWVLAQHRRRGTAPGFIATYLTQPIVLDPELLKIPIPADEPIARVPIARLWDSDRYDRTNPEVTAETKIGIAEVANANFLSEDTRRGEYPHPAPGNLVKYTGTYPKTGETRAYYRKPGAGLPVDPVAAECALEEVTGFVDLCVDDAVWAATAALMLPRAVRYAQEALDYFFRGQFTAWQDAAAGPGNFLIRIRNLSPERMTGKVTLYYDPSTATRLPVPGARYDVDLGPKGTQPGNADGLPPDTTAGPLPFAPPPDSAGRYTATFEGTLGNETPALGTIGAVAGRVLRPRLAFMGRTCNPEDPSCQLTLLGLYRWDAGPPGEPATITPLTQRKGGETFSDVYPAWSPDGSELAFISNKGTGTQFTLWFMDADGGNRRQALDAAQAPIPMDGRPAWHPDGTQLAFTGPTGTAPPMPETTFYGQRDLFLYDRARGTLRRLTGTTRPPERTLYDFLHPAWSPDGTQLALASVAGDRLVDPDAPLSNPAPTTTSSAW